MKRDTFKEMKLVPVDSLEQGNSHAAVHLNTTHIDCCSPEEEEKKNKKKEESGKRVESSTTLIQDVLRRSPVSAASPALELPTPERGVPLGGANTSYTPTRGTRSSSKSEPGGGASTSAPTSTSVPSDPLFGSKVSGQTAKSEGASTAESGRLASTKPELVVTKPPIETEPSAINSGVDRTLEALAEINPSPPGQEFIVPPPVPLPGDSVRSKSLHFNAANEASRVEKLNQKSRTPRKTTSPKNYNESDESPTSRKRTQKTSLKDLSYSPSATSTDGDTPTKVVGRNNLRGGVVKRLRKDLPLPEPTRGSRTSSAGATPEPVVPRKALKKKKKRNENDTE
jgi:hypothetical protein